MNEKKKFKQLNLDDRKVIERYLDEGKSFPHIARDLNVAPSTIYREVKRNRRCDGTSRNKGADRTDCEHFRSCKTKVICDFDMAYITCERKLCKRCHQVLCSSVCNKYTPRICQTVTASPFVCNACTHYPRCISERFKYSAQSAQSQADFRAKESRAGFDMTAEEVTYLVETVRAGFRLKHSIHHIFMSNEMPCSERTFYRLVENQDLPIIGIELAKKAKYKKRKRKKNRSVHARGFYKGREYKDYLDLPLRDRAITTEVDTVWGKRSDKKCILSLHRVDLHFQIYLLLESRTTAEVVAALDWLEQCSEGRFSEFFGLLLADRGSEFDDFEGIESSSGGNEKRCRIFYADPSRPDQRGSGEKNHVELRKVIPKGTSLADMNSYILAEICSHVNSTIRKGCGSSTPMHLAKACLPSELLENLGLCLIPANEVIAAPGILYTPTK